MARSRSSFEISGAVATATSLSGEGDERPRLFQGVALVSFGAAPAAPSPVRAGTPRVVTSSAPPAPRQATPPPPDPAVAEASSSPRPPSEPPDSIDPRRPPKLPDLSNVVSPIVRCQRIIEWIEEATGASDVFLADGSGLPLAGAPPDSEARLAGAGVVASSVTRLVASLPGSTAPLFELHVGDGPFFQLVGFEAHGAPYLVGLTRATPLNPRQAHAIRLACRHALGDSLGGAT